MRALRLCAVALLGLLTACSTSTNPAWQTMQYFFQSGEDLANPRLNPDFRFLRIVVEGRIAFIALGDVDKDVHGPVEVWYSAQKEVLRFQNGRLVGASGLNTEWRNVSLPPLPSWSALARDINPVRWVRVRDVMPGYKFTLQDQLVLRRISAPDKSELLSLAPESLTWFEERMAPATSPEEAAVSSSPLPPARYAVSFEGDGEVVVYGEQCLAIGQCFSWQRWPAEARVAANTHSTNP